MENEPQVPAGTTLKEDSRRMTRHPLPKLSRNSSRTHTSDIQREFDSDSITEVICLTSYPPRECGIATFSQDLNNALSKKFGGSFRFTIYPLETGGTAYRYDNKVAGTLNTNLALDFLKAAHAINANKQVGLVLIQHEFGLFPSDSQSFHEFLSYVDKPVVITFHTVLPEPTPEMYQEVTSIASLVSGIIVMTKSSAKILTEAYGIASEKMTVIAHGTHLVAYGDRKKLKRKYDLQGRTVLSTFGLLGPNKSIETSLEALPEIIGARPDTLFLVIGKTHPTLIEEKGESYRDFLIKKIDSLGIGDHVRFVDKFVPLDELLEYLQLTDIYLFTSKDPKQAVSGTFAYALSCGCPVVSTPIPHALEVLNNEAGVIFDFEDSEQLGRTVVDLLGINNARKRMSLNGMHDSSAAAWENSAIAHAELFAKVSDNITHLRYSRPPIDLRHIKKMTTHVGIIQFAETNRPDIESGYTLDDNARALVALCQHYMLTGDKDDLKYIKTYFDFVYCCFRHDCKFLNYVDKDYQFTDQNDTVNLEDACGRAVWALGYLISISGRLPEKYSYIGDKANFIFRHAIESLKDVQSPRALAFALKGLYFYNRFEGRESVNDAVKTFADRLANFYNEEAGKNWKWFESYMTYGNSVMPQAMLMAYSMTLDPIYGDVAKDSFDFLLSKIFVGNTIRVISNENWYQRGEELNTDFKGGEQPIDVAYTILALKLFHKIYPNGGYEKYMSNAFDWFLGRNPLHQTLYNPATGGCYDGLELHNVNLNQGAESTVSFVLARLALENIDLS